MEGDKEVILVFFGRDFRVLIGRMVVVAIILFVGLVLVLGIFYWF